jgi:hypothetical protein
VFVHAKEELSMFLRKFFDRHFKAQAQQRTTRPQLERLEDRALLSFAPPVFYSAADPGSPNVATTGAIAIAEGDFGRDGTLGLVVANSSSSNITVYTGNGRGGFAVFGGVFAVGQNPDALAVGDFGSSTSNRPDGIPDIVVANRVDNDINLLIGDGEGGFTVYKNLDFGVGIDPQAVAVGDFNGDGLLDVAVANFGLQVGGNDGRLSVLLRRSDGGFNQTVLTLGINPNAVAVADFNRDGVPDLVVSNFGSNTVSVLLGNGDGSFQAAQNFNSGSGPDAVAVDDFNRDGIPDLAVANQKDGTVSVLLGNGNGTFKSAVAYAAASEPKGMTVSDFNGDGKLDLAVADFGFAGGNVSLLLGNADGTFQSPINLAAGTNTGTTGIVAGDFNRDGRFDLAVPDFVSPNGAATGGAGILLNQSASATVVNATPSPSFAGQAVTLTATVSAVAPATGTPTGTITFRDNGAFLGQAQALNGGVATLTTTALAAGTNALTAVYSGDTNFSGSSGQVSTFVDARLSATGVNVTVAHGTTATNVTVATFTDGDPNGLASQFKATIAWGDGTAASTGTIAASANSFTVMGSHTFASPGRYTVSVAIQDSGGSSASSTSKAVVGSVNERFVSQAFLDLLQRPVDATGLQVFSAALDAGLPPSQVAQGITSSQEYRTDLIAADYQLFLHRTADLTGLGNFLNFLAGGGTDEQVAVALTGSAEYFQNRGGGTNDGFLTALFQDALGRPIDAGARASFNQQLAGGTTRSQVAATIFASTEYRQDLVGGYYLRFLHRPADSAGLANFVSALGNGAKDEDVIAALVGSGEYLARL